MTERYYDINGNPMTLEEWAIGPNGGWKIGKDAINGIDVSTVWLGMNHSWTGGIAIFETMTFPENGNGVWEDCQWRYATKENAKLGHGIVCNAIRENKMPNDIEDAMNQITSS
jgi:hypothetical protein